MKRLLATTVAGAAVALAGCGGTTQHHPTAAAQCAHWKAAAQTFAHNFDAGIPNVTAQTEQQLAAATYKVNATSHNLVCK